MSATAERIPQQAIEAAKAVSVLTLAERHSELRRESGREFAGACPKCGGNDRFHVTEDWFFCRQCHSKRGDSIEFVRWLEPGLSFADAVARLAGGQGSALPAAPVARRKPERRRQPAQNEQQALAVWLTKAERLVAESQARLWRAEGEPGQAYLEGRALEPATWLAYGLGYQPDVALPGTHGKRREPAIVLPWYVGGKVVAVRYRFLKEHVYTDSEDKERKVKQTSLWRAYEGHMPFAGRLFGGQVLPRFAPDAEQPTERLRALLLVEGEINGMSVWQCAGGPEVDHDWRLDVLSLGSESAKLSPAAVQFAQRYGAIFAWADRAEVAQSLMAALPGAHGIRSPGGQDANDLQRAGLLGGFLMTMRADAAKSTKELEGLLWALWDTAHTLRGLDTGSAQVALSLAAKLGKEAALVEAEPDRWITAEGLAHA